MNDENDEKLKNRFNNVLENLPNNSKYLSNIERIIELFKRGNILPPPYDIFFGIIDLYGWAVRLGKLDFIEECNTSLNAIEVVVADTTIEDLTGLLKRFAYRTFGYSLLNEQYFRQNYPESILILDAYNNYLKKLADNLGNQDPVNLPCLDILHFIETFITTLDQYNNGNFSEDPTYSELQSDEKYKVPFVVLIQVYTKFTSVTVDYSITPQNVLDVISSFKANVKKCTRLFDAYYEFYTFFINNIGTNRYFDNFNEKIYNSLVEGKNGELLRLDGFLTGLFITAKGYRSQFQKVAQASQDRKRNRNLAAEHRKALRKTNPKRVILDDGAPPKRSALSGGGGGGEEEEEAEFDDNASSTYTIEDPRENPLINVIIQISDIVQSLIQRGYTSPLVGALNDIIWSQPVDGNYDDDYLASDVSKCIEKFHEIMLEVVHIPQLTNDLNEKKALIVQYQILHAELQEIIASQKARIGALEAGNEDQIKRLQEDSGKKDQEIRTLSGQIAELKEQITALEGKLSTTSDTFKQYSEIVHQLVKATTFSGDEELVRLHKEYENLFKVQPKKGQQPVDPNPDTKVVFDQMGRIIQRLKQISEERKQQKKNEKKGETLPPPLPPPAQTVPMDVEASERDKIQLEMIRERKNIKEMDFKENPEAENELNRKIRLEEKLSQLRQNEKRVTLSRQAATKVSALSTRVQQVATSLNDEEAGVITDAYVPVDEKSKEINRLQQRLQNEKEELKELQKRDLPDPIRDFTVDKRSRENLVAFNLKSILTSSSSSGGAGDVNLDAILTIIQDTAYAFSLFYLNVNRVGVSRHEMRHPSNKCPILSDEERGRSLQGMVDTTSRTLQVIDCWTQAVLPSTVNHYMSNSSSVGFHCCEKHFNLLWSLPQIKKEYKAIVFIGDRYLLTI